MLLITLSFWVAGAAEATRNSDEKLTRVFKNRIVEKAIQTEQSDRSRDEGALEKPNKKKNATLLKLLGCLGSILLGGESQGFCYCIRRGLRNH